MEQTIGEVISSRDPLSVEWKIPNSRSIDRIFSPIFQLNNISFKIGLITESYQHKPFLLFSNVLEMGIFQTNEARNENNFTYKIGIKRRNGSVYKFVEGKKGDNWCKLMSENELLQKIHNLSTNGLLTFFVELFPNDSSIKLDSPSSTYSESSTVSSPSCFTCGHEDSNGRNELAKNLTDSYLNKEFCDITIHVGEQQFRAHKFILSARSQVFAAMMKHDMAEKNSNSVNVDDCEPEIFQEFLFYLYSGEVKTLSNENVIGLYIVADKYNVDYLKTDCVNFMKSNLFVNIFCDVIQLATNYNELELLKLSKEYFTKNAKKIILSAKWKSFLKENSELANDLFLLVVPDT